MNGLAKTLIVLALIVYVVSPVDFVPGPIDDIILILMAVATQPTIQAIED